MEIRKCSGWWRLWAVGKIPEQDTEAYMLLWNRIFYLNDRHIAPEKLGGKERERERVEFTWSI